MIKMKISELKTAVQSEEEARNNPEVRRELERTELANAIAIRIIKYRAENELSQTDLARQLGMHQSSIARLETGDHEPSLATLGKLAKGLGVEFHIDIETDGTVTLNPEESDRAAVPSQPDIVQVYLETIHAGMRAQLKSQEVLERAILLWEPSRLELPDLGNYLTRLRRLFVLRRAREGEDEVSLEEFERLIEGHLPRKANA
jgi:transcriptional regulator with XRE-family HTH domain